MFLSIYFRWTHVTHDGDKNMTLGFAKVSGTELRRAKSVDVAVITPYVDDSVGDGGRGEDITFSLIAPLQ